MSQITGQTILFPNSQTIKGYSLIQEVFEDLFIKGINQDLNLNNHKIINLQPGTNPTDAVNVSQLSSSSGPQTKIQNPIISPTEILSLDNVAHSLNLQLNGIPNKIVVTPTLAQFQMNIDVPNVDLTSAFSVLNLTSADSLYWSKTASLNDQAANTNVDGTIHMNGNQLDQLIDPINPDEVSTKNYTDNKNYIHYDSNDNSRISCISDTQLQLKIDGQVVCDMYNDGNDGINQQSNGYQFNCVGTDTNNNNFFINGQKQQITGINSTSLQIQQNDYATIGNQPSLAIINMGLQGGKGASIDFGSGKFPSNPVGLQNPAFIQSLNPDGDVMALSAGQALADNTIAIYADKNSSTHPIQTQFIRKSGYDPTAGITITENDQFTTKQYVDNSTSGFLPSSSTLNSIANTNLTSADVDINSHKLINVSNPVSLQDAANKQYVDTAISTTLPSSSTVQSIYSSHPSDLNLATNRFRSSYSPSTSDDIVNIAYLISQLLLYYPKTFSLQNIFTNVPSGINFLANEVQSSFVPISNSDLVNLLYLVNNYMQKNQTLQQIYTANNSNLDIGSSVFSSSHIPTINNQLVPYQSVRGVNSIVNQINDNTTSPNSFIQVTSSGIILNNSAVNLLSGNSSGLVLGVDLDCNSTQKIINALQPSSLNSSVSGNPNWLISKSYLYQNPNSVISSDFAQSLTPSTGFSSIQINAATINENYNGTGTNAQITKQQIGTYLQEISNQNRSFISSNGSSSYSALLLNQTLNNTVLQYGTNTTQVQLVLSGNSTTGTLNFGLNSGSLTNGEFRYNGNQIMTFQTSVLTIPSGTIFKTNQIQPSTSGQFIQLSPFQISGNLAFAGTGTQAVYFSGTDNAHNFTDTTLTVRNGALLNVQPSQTTANVLSIQCANSIWTGAYFVAQSSRYQKKEIDSEESCLERMTDLLSRLEFRKYKWIDQAKNDHNVYCGLFAEQVQECGGSEFVVESDQQDVPNIYRMSQVVTCTHSVEGCYEYSVTWDKAIDLSKIRADKELIKVYGDIDITEYSCKIICISENDIVFQCEHEIGWNNNIFIYGQKNVVTCSLKKDQMNESMLVVLKHQQKKIGKLESEIQELKEMVLSLIQK